MRPNVSASLRLIGFALLVAGSLGLKATAGPPNDGFAQWPAGAVEGQLLTDLRAQGFSTHIQRFRFRTALIVAEKGSCRAAVRDAREGADLDAVFRSDTANIGPMRYLYSGRAFPTFPQQRMRLVRLETEAQRLFGSRAPAPAVVALATAPRCSGSDLGLGHISTGS